MLNDANIVNGVGLCLLPINLCIIISGGRFYYRRDKLNRDVSSTSLPETLEALQQIIPSVTSLRKTNNELWDFEPLKRNLYESFSLSSFQILFTGSTAERFGLPRNQRLTPTADVRSSHALVSDCDVMVFTDDVSVGYSLESTLKMVHDPSLRPGFVKIIQNNSNIPVMFQDSFQLSKSKKHLSKLPSCKQGLPCLNATRIKDITLDCLGSLRLKHFPQQSACSPKVNIATLTKHGPAVTLELRSAYGYNSLVLMQHVSNYLTFMVDITFSLKCQWPCISDWQSRAKRWPEQYDVINIINMGCHLVPKSEEGDSIGETWRISFSNAELELSKLISEKSRACFLGFKVIFKDHLKSSAPWLTTYHAKTIFYNTLMETGDSVWQGTDVDTFVIFLLDKLYTAILENNCPHHFISSINLFDHKVMSKDKNCLLKKIRTIQKNLVKYIEKPDFYLDIPNDGCDLEKQTMFKMVKPSCCPKEVKYCLFVIIVSFFSVIGLSVFFLYVYIFLGW